MAKRTSKSAIKCRATRRYLLNGIATDDLQGIRVTVAYPQKRTLREMAKSINNACSYRIVPGCDKRTIIIPDVACFCSATACIILRIEIQHNLPAGEVRQGNGISVLVRQLIRVN